MRPTANTFSESETHLLAMRNQREVKIVTTNLESLFEEKKQQEHRLCVINSVIDNYKTWLTDEGTSQFTFLELMTQLAELPDEHTVERTNIQQNLPYQEPTRNEQANNEIIQKVMNRLDVFEEAISSLKSSNQRNENQILSINQLCQDFTSNYDKKLAEHQKIYETFKTDQTESLQDLCKELRHQRVLVDGISKTVHSAADENKEKFAKLFDDISATHDAVSLKMKANASSTSGQVEILSDKIMELVNEMSTFKSVAARQEKDQIDKINDVDRKIGTVCTLMLKRMAAMRNTFDDHVTDQSKRKEKMEPKLAGTSKTLAAKSLEQLSHKKGFYMLRKESSLSIYHFLNQFFSPSKPDKRYKKRILSLKLYYNNTEYETNIEDCRKTCIFKMESNGIYLIYSKVVFNMVEPSEIHLSLVSRMDDKISSLSTISSLKASNEGCELIKLIYLEQGKEICLETSASDHRGIHLKSFVCTKLM